MIRETETAIDGFIKTDGSRMMGGMNQMGRMANDMANIATQFGVPAQFIPGGMVSKPKKNKNRKLIGC